MEFLQKNARAIIIALLAVGVVVAISASGDTNNEEASNQESSEVATTEEAVGPVAPTETEESEETVAPEEMQEAAETESDTTETETTEPTTEETSESEESAATEETDEAEASEDEADEASDVAPESNGDVVRQDDDYSASAQAGDSQTTLLRKLIAQYESENDVTLTAPQQLYVETNLVDDIGETDFIEVGTEVKLTGAEIKTRVEEARNLSEDTLALWAQYL